jgi:hypothetical protein
MDAAEAAHGIAGKLGMLPAPGFVKRVTFGAAAGAVGTTALNLATHVDMLIRGRPASETPTEVVKRIETRIPGGSDPASGAKAQPEAARNRRQALGSLLGFAAGLGIGAAFGLARPGIRGIPVALAGAIAGLAAMAASDVPATLLGATDPTTWKPEDWAADAVPHMAYGLTTALMFDALADPYE